MPLNTMDAQSELSRAYKEWSRGTSKVSNSPFSASEISRATSNTMRLSWSRSTNNSANQTMRTGFTTKKGITKWVTVSLSGGGSVIDFHAVWGTDVTKGFLWHFKIVG